MNFKNVYDKVNNPIDDVEQMKKIIEIYKESENLSELEDKLINKKNIGEIVEKDKNEFYCMMFEEWKNNIVEMSFKQFSSLVQNEDYKKNFSKMRDFLQNLEPVKNKKEVDNIIYGKYKGKDAEIDEILKTYYWIKDEDSEWEYIYNKVIKLEKLKEFKIKYLFMLNLKTEFIYKFAKKFIEKCKEYELSYNIKFQKNGKVINNFVIGFNEEDLVSYLKIFDDLKKKSPEVLQGVERLPIFTGRLSSWLGVCSCIDENIDMNFYESRLEALNNGLANHVKKYLKLQENNTELIGIIEEKLYNEINTKQNQKVIELFGAEEIAEVIKETIPEFIDDYAENNTQDFEISDGETPDVINVSKNNLQSILKNTAIEGILKSDLEILNIIETIKESCNEKGIDHNKICFDKG